jgi:hypothetical protein
MAKQIKKVEKPVEKTVKVGHKMYPLIKPTVIGSVLRPVGYKIALTEKSYRIYKQKKII